MECFRENQQLSAWVGQRAQRGRIGLVPTMGFLHQGHTSLMAQLRPQVDSLMVSIFVNPLQFGEGEDLDRYPKSLERDQELCKVQGVDAVFAPEVFYPAGFQTSVAVHELAQGLCGARRPGHFDGVTTVVARLFALSRCDDAIFGEKDYQQLAVIRRMAGDLGFPVEIHGAPIVRESDGLACSSRNAYLSQSDRARAASLSRALQYLARSAQQGQRSVQVLREQALSMLDVDELEYLEVVDTDTLQPLEQVDRSARALVAARLGTTRLIDNCAVEGD